MSNAALRQLNAPLQTPQEESSPRRRFVDLPRIAPRRGPKLAHGVVALIGLGAIVAAQLGMSVALSDGAYQLQGLQVEHAQSQRTQQSLQERMSALASPQGLATGAEALGMENGGERRYIELATGAVTVGPDALHVENAARVGTSRLAVPNALVQSERDLSAIRQGQVMAEQRHREAQGYPGMLLPSQGVADRG